MLMDGHTPPAITAGDRLQHNGRHLRIYFSLLAECITHLLLCVTRKESREHNKPPRMSQIAIERLGSKAGGCCCFCIPESQIARRPELSAPFISGGRKAKWDCVPLCCQSRETERDAPELLPKASGDGRAGCQACPPHLPALLSFFLSLVPLAFQPAVSLCGKCPCSPAAPKALSASSQKRLCSSRGDLPPWKGPPLASTS